MALVKCLRCGAYKDYTRSQICGICRIEIAYEKMMEPTYMEANWAKDLLKKSSEASKNPAAPYGALRVVNGDLVGQDGQHVMLRGMSTHGIQWFPQYYNQSVFQHLKDDWHTNVIRVAMYVEENGYTNDGARQGKNYAKMIECIDAAIAVGLYVIVDWHVSNADQTPLKHQDEALDFFRAISVKYPRVPNVIYEICNEPNNAGNDYGSQIANYANLCIKLIRETSPDAIVIIGSGDWSKDCVEAWRWDRAHGNDRKNCLYTLHQYCDGNFDSGWVKGQNIGWSPAIAEARHEGCPIFATEAGVSNAAENNWGTQEEFKKIIKFYEEYKIPYCIWSLCDKSEPSSILNPGANTTGQWREDEVSAAGHLVRDYFWKGAASDQAPTPQPAPQPSPSPAPAPNPPAPSPVPAPSPNPLPTNALVVGKRYKVNLEADSSGIHVTLSET